MNPTTHETEGSASAPVLYMGLELSNRSWRLVFGDGGKQRQVSVPAAVKILLALERAAHSREMFPIGNIGSRLRGYARSM